MNKISIIQNSDCKEKKNNSIEINAEHLKRINYFITFLRKNELNKMNFCWSVLTFIYKNPSEETLLNYGMSLKGQGKKLDFNKKYNLPHKFIIVDNNTFQKYEDNFGFLKKKTHNKTFEQFYNVVLKNDSWTSATWQEQREKDVGSVNGFPDNTNLNDLIEEFYKLFNSITKRLIYKKVDSKTLVKTGIPMEKETLTKLNNLFINDLNENSWLNYLNNVRKELDEIYFLEDTGDISLPDTKKEMDEYLLYEPFIVSDDTLQKVKLLTSQASKNPNIILKEILEKNGDKTNKFIKDFIIPNDLEKKKLFFFNILNGINDDYKLDSPDVIDIMIINLHDETEFVEEWEYDKKKIMELIKDELKQCISDFNDKKNIKEIRKKLKTGGKSRSIKNKRTTLIYHKKPTKKNKPKKNFIQF